MIYLKEAAGIKFIAIVNAIAAIFHFVFWVFVLTHLPCPWSDIGGLDRTDLIVTYGLGIADLIWSVPFLIIGSLRLMRYHLLGWLAAQMANCLYWYSFTFILFREFNMHHIRLGTILFLPFALFSIWSAWYLWKVRSTFWQS